MQVFQDLKEMLYQQQLFEEHFLWKQLHNNTYEKNKKCTHKNIINSEVKCTSIND